MYIMNREYREHYFFNVYTSLSNEVHPSKKGAILFSQVRRF